MFPNDEEDEYLSVAEMDADSAGFLGSMAYAGNVPGDDGRGAAYDYDRPVVRDMGTAIDGELPF